MTKRIAVAVMAAVAVLTLAGDAQATKACPRQTDIFYVDGRPDYGTYGQGLGVLVCNRDAKETPPAQH